MDTDNPAGGRVKCQRRRKWIRPDLQLKVVLRTLLVAVVVLLVYLQLSLFWYWFDLKNAEATTGELLARVPSMLLKHFAFSVFLAVPLSLYVGISSFFNFSGPLYRFSRHLSDWASGRWDRDCRLREGDELQDLNAAINRALGVMRERVVRQHGLLEETRRVLQSIPNDDQKVAELLERMADESKEYERRLGEETREETGEETSESGTEPAGSEPGRGEKEEASVPAS